MYGGLGRNRNLVNIDISWKNELWVFNASGWINLGFTPGPGILFN